VGAWVGVAAFQEVTGRQVGGHADTRTDAEGRFSLNSYVSDSYAVTVYPMKDEPYLAAARTAGWPKGSGRQEVDIKLVRGVAVRGKVVESDGKAVVSSSVSFVPQRDNNPELPPGALANPGLRVFSGDDGSFRIVVPPGRGHFLVTGPTHGYTYSPVTGGEL